MTSPLFPFHFFLSWWGCVCVPDTWGEGWGGGVTAVGLIYSESFDISLSLSTGTRQCVVSLAPLWTERYLSWNTRHRYGLLYSIIQLTSYFPPSISLLQQWRLLPYLASVYVLTHFGYRLFDEFTMFAAGTMMGDKSKRQVSQMRGCQRFEAH